MKRNAIVSMSMQYFACLKLDPKTYKSKISLYCKINTKRPMNISKPILCRILSMEIYC